MKNNIALLIIPVTILLMGCESEASTKSYQLQSSKTKSGYLVRVVNNTPKTLRCQLVSNRKRNKVVVRGRETSEPYFYNSVPKLTCVSR